jgi:hypothetical protein
MWVGSDGVLRPATGQTPDRPSGRRFGGVGIQWPAAGALECRGDEVTSPSLAGNKSGAPPLFGHYLRRTRQELAHLVRDAVRLSQEDVV